MKLQITLSNRAGVLDACDIDTGDDDSAEVSGAIWNAIDHWVLAPGDIIRVGEDEEALSPGTA